MLTHAALALDAMEWFVFGASMAVVALILALGIAASDGVDE